MSQQRLIPRVREVLRRKHYNLETEKHYVKWIIEFIKYHKLRHPSEMAGKEIEAFLTSLAVEGQMTASTQNQAINALAFLYREVLELQLDDLYRYLRDHSPQTVPDAHPRDEMAATGRAGAAKPITVNTFRRSSAPSRPDLRGSDATYKALDRETPELIYSKQLPVRRGRLVKTNESDYAGPRKVESLQALLSELRDILDGNDKLKDETRFETFIH